MWLNIISFLLPITFHTVGIQNEDYPVFVGEKKEKIMLLGDSLCKGMARRFDKLADENNYIPISKCKIGTTSLQWDMWIDDEINKWRPDIVLISLGTNDGWIIDRVVKNPEVYKRIYDNAGLHGAKVIWIEPPQISRKTIKGIDKVRSFLHRDIPVMFESEKFIVPPTGDGVHLTEIGYNMWMDKIWSWMKEKKITGHLENL